MTNQTSGKSKVVYLVLTAFLGAIGIHKFYLGKNLAGVLYLLFFWTGVPAFLALIDFIIGLFKPTDQFGNLK